jgi:hypothetical protein
VWRLFCVWDWRIGGGEGGGGAEPIGTSIKRNGKSSASTNRVSFPILWMTKKNNFLLVYNNRSNFNAHQ